MTFETCLQAPLSQHCTHTPPLSTEMYKQVQSFMGKKKKKALQANGVATKPQERPSNKNRPHGPLPKTLLQNKHTVTGGGIKTSATTWKFSQSCLQPAAVMHFQQIQTVFELSPRRSAGTSKAITALMKAVCSLLTQRGHANPPPRQLI